MKRVLIGSVGIVVVVATAVAVALATRGPSACSLAGCGDGFSVAITGAPSPGDSPLYVRVCALGDCEQTRVSGRSYAPPHRRKYG